MSQTNAPSWFNWFHDLGAQLSCIPTAQLGEESVRVLISAPNLDFAAWAIAAGSLSVEKKTSISPTDGDRVVTWVKGKMQDTTFTSGNERYEFSLGGTSVAKGHTWPIAFVPAATPEGRSPRPVDQDSKSALRNAWGREKWYKTYASKCVNPVTIVGRRTEQTEQLAELMKHCADWFTDEEQALFAEDSMQVTNPNKFGMFPFMVLNQGVAAPRPWLREMESRLVIATSFASHKGMSRYFQQGVPRVILSDRRSSGSIDANSFINEMFESGDHPRELDFRPAPAGIYTAVFAERVLVDPKTDEAAEDIEEFEL